MIGFAHTSASTILLLLPSPAPLPPSTEVSAQPTDLSLSCTLNNPRERAHLPELYLLFDASAEKILPFCFRFLSFFRELFLKSGVPLVTKL